MPRPTQRHVPGMSCKAGIADDGAAATLLLFVHGNHRQEYYSKPRIKWWTEEYGGIRSVFPCGRLNNSNNNRMIWGEPVEVDRGRHRVYCTFAGF